MAEERSYPRPFQWVLSAFQSEPTQGSAQMRDGPSIGASEQESNRFTSHGPELHQKVKYLEQELVKSRQNLENQGGYFNGLVWEKDQAILRLSQIYNDDLAAWNTHTAELVAKVDALVNEQHILREEHAARAEQVRIAQETAFRRMDDENWAPQEDNVIRAELKKLEGALRAWAKQYSSRDGSVWQFLTPGDMSKVADLLGNVAWQPDKFLAAVVNEPKWKDKSPFLLTQMVIAKYAFTRVFQHPFLFIQGRSSYADRTYIKTVLGSEMDFLYGEFQKIDTAQACSWRSQTLRLLNTPNEKNRIQKKTIVKRKQTCEALASSLLHGPTSLLFRKINEEQAEERFEKLVSILSTASEISARLWTQRTHINCVSLSELGNFNVDSPIMSAHRIQKLDEDDTRLNGNRILAVVQPAIAAFGDNNGENYDEHRVWLKAIVIVEE